MSKIQFSSMPSEQAEAYRSGAADAYGHPPEVHVSTGDGIPCRHCLNYVAEGDSYLILAYRPFPHAQPYAETGPIFLHAQRCERYPETDRIPPMALSKEPRLLKGYGANDRIVYGTGEIVASTKLAAVASKILARDDVSYVHVRSALNNCFSCRIDRV